LTEGKEIVGLKPLPFFLREMAIGQERFLAAAAGMSELWHLPYLEPLVEVVTRQLADRTKSTIYVDALRVVHFLFSNGWTPDKLRGRKYREHRNDLNRLLKTIVDIGRELTETDEVEALTLNAELQPWYQALMPGAKVSIGEIRAYKEGRDGLDESALDKDPALIG
jgi:hypothetical protein